MSKTLKILALASWYPNSKDPQLGVFVKHQLCAIGSKHKVILHTLEAQVSNKEKGCSINGGFTHTSHYYTPTNSYVKPMQWYIAWKKILQSLENEKFDLIHTHVAFPIGIIALQAKKRLNIPLILSEHWSGYGSNREYSGWLRKKITRSLINSSTSVIVNSNYLRGLMENQNLISKYFTVPNIVSFSKEEKTKNELPSGKFVFMNIADHIDSDKNISGLLEAFSQVKKTNSNIILVQIGDGPDNNMLRYKAKNLGMEKDIIWKGRLSNEEVLKEINHCDVGVINSNQETFSIVAFEFLAAKKPIIITDCGGPIEHLPYDFGIKIPVNNKIDLAKAIDRIRKGKQTINIEKSAIEVREKFSQSSFINKVEIAYQHALGQ